MTITVVFFFSFFWLVLVLDLLFCLLGVAQKPLKDQITNAVKAQVLPFDYDWREEDPRLTDFTEPINVTFEVRSTDRWVDFLGRFLWTSKKKLIFGVNIRFSCEYHRIICNIHVSYIV